MPNDRNPIQLRLTPTAKRASIVGHATLEIRRAILDGRMAPGTVASISQLSERLQMSAIPIREALRVLEVEGLIVLRPNRRAIVAPISLSELKHIYFVRKTYEVELAVHSAADHSLDAVQRLGNVADGLSMETSPEVRLELHSEFHRTLVAPAASDFDWRLLQIIWNASDRYVRFNLSVLSPSALRSSHEAILEAARDRSPTAMRGAMIADLDEGLATLARSFDGAS